MITCLVFLPRDARQCRSWRGTPGGAVRGRTHILSRGELLLQKCEGRQMVQDTGHAEGDEPAERLSLTFLSGNF